LAPEPGTHAESVSAADEPPRQVKDLMDLSPEVHGVGVETQLGVEGVFKIRMPSSLSVS
jgi:hypothetical protein